MVIADEIAERLERLEGKPLSPAAREAVDYVLDRFAAGVQPSSLLSGSQRLSRDPALAEHLGLDAEEISFLTSALLGSRSPTGRRDGIIRQVARELSGELLQR